MKPASGVVSGTVAPVNESLRFSLCRWLAHVHLLERHSQFSPSHNKNSLGIEHRGQPDGTPWQACPMNIQCIVTVYSYQLPQADSLHRHHSHELGAAHCSNSCKTVAVCQCNRQFPDVLFDSDVIVLTCGWLMQDALCDVYIFCRAVSGTASLDKLALP